MVRFQRRADAHTVRWYKRMFMVEMISGKEYDLTWPVYIVGLLFLIAIFS